MSNLNLWQIKKEYSSLLSNLYDHETGEINHEVDAQLSSLADSAENKCIAIQKWILNLESEKKQIEFMEEQIAKRKKCYENEIKKRSDYLESNMKSLGIDEIKCPFFTLKIKKNPLSTDIVNEEIIPDKFMIEREIIKKEIKPDKNAIKEEFVKTGIQVPGAIVSQKSFLKLFVNQL
jgi:hypothetical protein